VFCPKCGKEIRDDSTFCSYCGEPVHAGNQEESRSPGVSPEGSLAPSTSVSGVVNAQPAEPDRMASREPNESPDRASHGLTPFDETPVKKYNEADGRRAIKGCLIFVIACVVLTFLLFRGCLTTPTTPSNTPTTTTIDLQASVKFTGTQFVITNNNSFAWTNVLLEINPGFVANGYWLRTDRMEAGSTYTVGALQFAKDDGTRLNPYTTKPTSISIQATTPNGTGFWSGGWE